MLSFLAVVSILVSLRLMACLGWPASRGMPAVGGTAVLGAILFGRPDVRDMAGLSLLDLLTVLSFVFGVLVLLNTLRNRAVLKTSTTGPGTLPRSVACMVWGWTCC